MTVTLEDAVRLIIQDASLRVFRLDGKLVYCVVAEKYSTAFCPTMKDAWLDALTFAEDLAFSN